MTRCRPATWPATWPATIAGDLAGGIAGDLAGGIAGDLHQFEGHTMDRRERIIQFLTQIAAIALAVLAARYGIPLPPITVTPPELPPITVTPPELQPPPVPKEPSPNTPAAIVRLSFADVGCSATVIGPRRPDGRYWVMTAAHCVTGAGQHGTIRFLDGRLTGVTVQAFDREADVAWMVTDGNTDTYPYALLAKSSPAVGSKVWHAGYGRDRPGNREEGEVTLAPDAKGQLRFRLSVSSGDSGGGIVTNADGEIVSCVCCTSERGAIAHVWGCSPEAAIRAKPAAMVLDDWKPIDVPLRMPAKQ